MRKSMMRLALVMICALTLSGCALLYNDLKTPLPDLTVTADAQGRSHVGRASCTSYVWLVSVGDCSVEAAMKDGGVTKVHHVDSEIKNYALGLYVKFTTVVYGD